ncbi:ATP-binding cassette domain-containing protein [Acuticoccus sp. M5D2P5]|uniref:ATP-binding cassette domain-containing protein n=1 Tax=Acuticoccus kalidii TaxID=2910977 RepID=UPI001F4388A8|nr:ATP-binding cassette domain-containing protein [Acuticoccus kalidii]MCF3936161.1 ATP-binding cassette domain-containing protein [Acuticoccus kalidii]
MTGAALQLHGVTKLYRSGRRFFGGVPVSAVDGVSLSIAPGETLGIVGESGSGKSTLGRIAAGIEAPSAGEVLFDGRQYARPGSTAWRKERRFVQLVFQNPADALDPRIRVREQVAGALAAHERLPPAERRRRVEDILHRVGLAEIAGRVPQQLSGGQLQRAVIARALVLQPRLLVCDEAVSALDVSVQAQVINLLMSLRTAFGLSLVFITHDLSVARHISDRIAVMRAGRIVETGDPDTLFSTPREDYTKRLVAAIPAMRHAPPVRPAAAERIAL